MSEFIEVLSKESKQDIQKLIDQLQKVAKEVNTINSAFQGVKVPSQATKEINRTRTATNKLNAEQKEAQRLSRNLQAQKERLRRATGKEAQELQAIMQKYQKAKEKPSQDVIADFQKRQMKLQQKQAAAMQDPEVQKAINDFNDAMMVEAKKIDPNTDALLARLKSQIEKVQSIRQKMQETMVK